MRGTLWTQLTVAGMVGWLVGVLLVRPDLAIALLMLGPLVVWPLTLGLACGGPPTGRWLPLAMLHLPAAMLLWLSFWYDAGGFAAALALPWLALTGVAAILGVLRFAEHGGRSWGESAIDAGLAFVVVGGFWLVVSRWGRPVAGFEDPIAILTAAHFHFAGFALPVVAGLAARHLKGRLPQVAAAGVILGMPLVATAIVLKDRGYDEFEPFAVVVFALAATLVAGLHGRLAFSRGPLGARVLWGLAGVTLPAGMLLALAYAILPHLHVEGLEGLTIPQMLHSHAILNVFGFTLPALLGWTLARNADAPRPRILVRRLDPMPAVESFAAPVIAASRQPGDDEDHHQRVLAKEGPGAPVRAGPYERVATAILHYHAFPDRVIKGAMLRTPVHDGDVVAGRAPLFAGLDIAFASQVVRVWDGPEGRLWRSGFAYRTLVGHPLAGEESFWVEKDGRTGEVRAGLDAWSRPAHRGARLLHGWTRRRQLAAAKAALDQLQDIAVGSAASRP